MFRTAMALTLLTALAVVQAGCVTIPDRPRCAGIPRIDPGRERYLRSPDDKLAVTITIKNKRAADVSVNWLDYEGKRKHYSNVGAGKEVRQGTFEGHYWLILDKDSKKALGIYRTPNRDAAIVVK
jgi:hypothetical protein